MQTPRVQQVRAKIDFRHHQSHYPNDRKAQSASHTPISLRLSTLLPPSLSLRRLSFRPFHTPQLPTTMTVEHNGSWGRSGVGYLKVGVLLYSNYGGSSGRCQLFTICSKCLSLKGRSMHVRMLAYNAMMHVSAENLLLHCCASFSSRILSRASIVYQH